MSTETTTPIQDAPSPAMAHLDTINDTAKVANPLDAIEAFQPPVDNEPKLRTKVRRKSSVPQSLEDAMKITPTSMNNVDFQRKYYQSLDIKSDEDGSGVNNTLHHFLRIMWFILTSRGRTKPFDINTVFNLLKFLPANETANVMWLYKRWIKLGLQLNIIESVHTCMDDPLFIVK